MCGKERDNESEREKMKYCKKECVHIRQNEKEREREREREIEKDRENVDSKTVSKRNFLIIVLRGGGVCVFEGGRE